MEFKYIQLFCRKDNLIKFLNTQSKLGMEYCSHETVYKYEQDIDGSLNKYEAGYKVIFKYL